MNKIRKGIASAELDLDKAIMSADKFKDEALDKGSYDDSVAVLFQMINFLYNTEIALRASATSVLDKFLAKYKNDVISYSEAEMKPEDNDILQRSNFINYHLLPSIRSVINTQYDELVIKSSLKVLKRYLICIHEIHKNEQCKEFIKELQVPVEFLDFACLIDLKDENIDFFENILNIKLQKRYKAIRHLCTKVEENEVKEFGTMTKLILPIADMFIIRMSQAQEKTRGVISYSKQNFEQINNECFILYEKVCQKLPWNLYQSIMRKHIMKLTGLNLKKGQRMAAGTEKNITKMICSIISGFHFDIPDVVDSLEQQLDARKNEGGLDELLGKIFGRKHEEREAKVDDGLASDSEEEKNDEENDNIQDQIEKILEKPQDHVDSVTNRDSILRVINKSFIPSLFKHLKDDTKKGDTLDDVKIRIHVAVAIVKLLRKTTNRDFNDGLQKLIRNVVGCLRSKVIKNRDRARDALVQVNLNLSTYLIHYTIDEMQKSLRKGYQRHVRSYTLHHILDSLVKENHIKIGQLDHCIDNIGMHDKRAFLSSSKTNQAITSILMDELFGKLGIEKDLEGVNMVKTKETKSKRALQTYEILAQNINFETTFLKLVTPILNRADAVSKASYMKKCEEVLSTISTNILKNSSVKAESLLIILYAIMKKGVNNKNRLKEEDQLIEEEKYVKPNRFKQIYQTMKVLPSWQRDLVYLRRSDNEGSKNLLLAFSLSTLKKAMGMLDIEQFKDKLDAFTYIYIDLMKSNDNKVLVNTLHVLGRCIKLELPSIKFFCRKIINNLFLLFTTSSDSEFMNSLFKCSTEMVKHMKEDLTDHQISRLTEIIKANLEHYHMQANVYGCLKALIEKKVLSSHIYDLVDIIADKMITHTNKGTRAICSQIFTIFLIDYPLEEKRVEQHVHHLIKNLTYVGKEGRSTVLEIIEKLIPQFPTKILDKYAFLLFLSMILRTVNESNTECKNKANTTLKLLLENVSASKRDDIIKTVLNWDFNIDTQIADGMSDELTQTGRSSMMKRVTILLIGLIITIEGDKFAGKYFKKTFEICSEEVTLQANHLRELYTVSNEKYHLDLDEQLQIDNVKKEMGAFLTEISLISEKDLRGSGKRRKVNEEVSHEQCLTLAATLNVIDKFIHQPGCWKIFYSQYISQESGQIFIRDLLEL